MAATGDPSVPYFTGPRYLPTGSPPGSSVPPGSHTRLPRGRGLRISGLIIGGVGLVVLALCAVKVVPKAATAIGDALESPSYAAPVDTSISMHRGEYAVFQLTGSQGGGVGFTFQDNQLPMIIPSMVTVTSSSGTPVQVTSSGPGVETLTRNGDIYTAAVYLHISVAGVYRVQIQSPAPTRVIVTKSFGADFEGAKGWLAAGGVSVIVALAGLVLLIAGLARGRAPTPVSAELTASWPGWYQDPYAPEQLRYWDGANWTTYSR